MDGVAITQWVATVLIACGLIYNIRQNNKKEKERNGKLKTELSVEIKGIKSKLDDPQDGLGAIRREISSMKERCAAVTSGFAERIKHAEQDIEKIGGGK